MFTLFAIGCKVGNKATGVVYTKTAPQQWEPNPAEGWALMRATDEHINTSAEFRPVAVRGRLVERKEPTLLERIMGDVPDELLD